MSRVGYCRHGLYVGYGANYKPCMYCESEQRIEQDRQESARLALRETIREIVKEELVSITEELSDARAAASAQADTETPRSGKEAG
jgi:hypothetical protein